MAAFLAVALVPSGADVTVLVLLRQGAELPLLIASAVAVSLASVLSFGLHSVGAQRTNPYSRWTEKPATFVLIAVVAGVVDLIVLRGLFVAFGFTATHTLILAKVGAMSAAGAVRMVLYRWVLSDLVRENRICRPQPLEQRPVRLTVVVPAFRERDRIGTTVTELRNELRDVVDAGGVEIVVVDDGSGDDTATAASRAGADLVLKLDQNTGKGAAVRAGVLAASGRVICFTDADLAYHPRHIRHLLSAVESGWDVAIGDRRHPSSRVVRQSRLRTMGSRLVNLISSIVLLDAPLDTQCGLKAFRSDVARSLFGRARLNGFAFDIEILHLVERDGWSLTRVPVQLDEAGAPSTVRIFRDTTRLAADMVRVRRWSSAGAYGDAARGFELRPNVGGGGSQRREVPSADVSASDEVRPR